VVLQVVQKRLPEVVVRLPFGGLVFGGDKVHPRKLKHHLVELLLMQQNLRAVFDDFEIQVGEFIGQCLALCIEKLGLEISVPKKLSEVQFFHSLLDV